MKVLDRLKLHCSAHLSEPISTDVKQSVQENAFSRAGAIGCGLIELSLRQVDWGDGWVDGAIHVSGIRVSKRALLMRPADTPSAVASRVHARPIAIRRSTVEVCSRAALGVRRLHTCALRVSLSG